MLEESRGGGGVQGEGGGAEVFGVVDDLEDEEASEAFAAVGGEHSVDAQGGGVRGILCVREEAGVSNDLGLAQ